MLATTAITPVHCSCRDSRDAWGRRCRQAGSLSSWIKHKFHACHGPYEQYRLSPLNDQCTCIIYHSPPPPRRGVHGQCIRVYLYVCPDAWLKNYRFDWLSIFRQEVIHPWLDPPLRWSGSGSGSELENLLKYPSRLHDRTKYDINVLHDIKLFVVMKKMSKVHYREWGSAITDCLVVDIN